MSAAIKNSLNGLMDSVELLDMAVQEAAHKKPQSNQQDLFAAVKSAQSSPSNANASNVQSFDSKAFAARLDNAIGRVEKMLKEGSA